MISKQTLSSGGVKLCALATLTLGLSAQAGEAQIRANIAARLKDFPKIEEIRKTPMPGLYEVRVNKADIFYSDENGDFILPNGELWDTRQGVNLTRERKGVLNPFDISQFPKGDAIVLKFGNGGGPQRIVYSFEDPNCTYCKQLGRTFRDEVKDATVYLYLYAILGKDSETKAKDIWCAKDPAKTWLRWMVDGIEPPSARCLGATPLERNRALGQRLNINGTPTLFFADGFRTAGALPAKEITRRLVLAESDQSKPALQR